MNKTLLILAAVTVSRCAPCPAQVVASTLFSECRGESLSGQRAVASVIWNRSKAQGKSPEAVCLARKQFSCHNGGYAKASPRNPAERAILARFEAWEREMQAGTFEPSTGADHYYNPAKAAPSWAKELKNVENIGRHTFGNCR